MRRLLSKSAACGSGQPVGLASWLPVQISIRDEASRNCSGSEALKL